MYADKNFIYFNYCNLYWNNFKEILKSIISFEYIERIKILIFFISYFLDNIKDENGYRLDFFIDFIYCINLDEENRSN